MLRSLHLKDVGPAHELAFEFAPRLNLLTGDNGLGKSFVLDVVWFLISTSWTGERAFPFKPRQSGEAARPSAPTIQAKFAHRNPRNDFEPETTLAYDKLAQQWRRQGWHPAPRTPGSSVYPDRTDEAELRPRSLVVYARSDGAVSVWDGYRAPARIEEFGSVAVHMTQRELWYGKRVRPSDGADELRISKGLIDDWVYWRNENGTAWKFLLRALKALSPPNEDLAPGEPVALKLAEDMLIPTLDLPYGIVPITLASAGMQRVLGLAYAIVWAWTRHVQAAEGASIAPTRDFVVLIDEIEAHLHPLWQRVILPSILSAIGSIAPNVAVQAFVATHSPLVLASLEPGFREAEDALFTFDLTQRTPAVVKVEKAEWRRMGDASDWLTSPVFDLKWARSVEAEKAILAAIKWLDSPRPTEASRERIERDLERALGDTDPFWMRWKAHRHPRRSAK